MPDLWGKIDMAKWKDLPCLRGRPATEQDVKEGRAVFLIPTGSTATDLQLPLCAIHKSEGDRLTSVVAIQAEETGGQVIIGLRYLESGNGICTLPELEVLEEPNEFFWKP